MEQKRMTLGEAARELGVPRWKLRKLYHRRLLPEPERVGISRVVTADDLPAIKQKLEEVGYLQPTEEAK